MSTARSPKTMTATEYLDWERQQTERHEFYDGEVFLQSGGTRKHSLIGSNTLGEIHRLLADHECEAHGSDMRVRIEAANCYVYPDVLVVCPPIEGEADDVIDNPVLVVEVLSPSSEDFDRGRKFGYYRMLPSLRDYLVISQDKARVEHHWRSEDGVWMLRDVEGLNASLHLASLDCDLKLGEVYAKVEFE